MRRPFPPPPRRSGKPGLVLVTALVILLLITVLALAMFRGMGTQARRADHRIEKQDSLGAAQNSLEYAEWWLSQGLEEEGTLCTDLLGPTPAPLAPLVCSNPLTDGAASLRQARLATVPWQTSAGIDLGVRHNPQKPTPANLPQAGSEAIAPRFYISPLGLDPSGLIQLYQVSAMAQAGSADSAAVVQSVYGVKRSVIDAGDL